MDLEKELDRLYALPLAEFVAARNELAKELRTAGDREAAAEIQKLVKPNVPAWAVNRLWLGERKAFERLLDAGAAVRAAVGAGRGGKEAGAQRNEAARELLARAKKLLAKAGHPPTPSVLQNISHTLDAVVAIGIEGLERPPGRLSRELEPPGFDFLAALTVGSPSKKKAKKGGATSRAAASRRPAKPRPSSSAGKSKPAKRQKPATPPKVVAAREALAEARAAAKAAEKEAARLEAELARAEKRAARTAAAAERAAETARKAAVKAAEAETAETVAAQTARAARTAARRAATAVTAAEARLSKLES